MRHECIGAATDAAQLSPLTLLAVTSENIALRRDGQSPGRGTARPSAVGLLLVGALTEWASWRWALYVNLTSKTRSPGLERSTLRTSPVS